MTINPGSDKGTVAEYTKHGKVYKTRKLSQFISDTTYTLQEIESKSSATLNTTYEVDRVNGDFVKTFWMTNTGLASRPPLIDRGKCKKKQAVETMF